MTYFSPPPLLALPLLTLSLPALLFLALLLPLVASRSTYASNICWGGSHHPFE